MLMIMITGQKGVLSHKQAKFQVVDIVSTMTPLTKMAQQIVSPATIPSIVREAFRVAREERPGPIHLELPEDIAAEPVPSMSPVPSHPIDWPVASQVAVDRAADLVLKADRPLVMLGAAASRPRLAEPLSSFVKRLQIPFFNTQMGKGAVTGGSGLYMGTAALSERDYVHWAIDRADLIIAIGHDTVEKPPFFMGPNGPTVLHVGYLPATVEEVYFPHAELVGNVGPSLALLADRLEPRRAAAARPMGAGLPSAIVAAMLNPKRRVLAVCGGRLGRRAVDGHAAAPSRERLVVQADDAILGHHSAYVVDNALRRQRIAALF
jgi:acetolactate synthase-1/2/3 large subunit